MKGHRLWPALLGAPLAALAQQSVLLSLVTPSCSRQSTAVLHAVSAAALLLVLLLTGLALGEWRRLRGIDHRISVERSRSLMFAAVAAWSGALSALTSLSMWLPVWVLSPCTG